MEANGGWHYLVNDPLFCHTVNVLRTVVCKVVQATLANDWAGELKVALRRVQMPTYIPTILVGRLVGILIESRGGSLKPPLSLEQRHKIVESINDN